MATKQYVDTTISGFTVGTTIQIYRIQKSDTTGWGTNTADNTSLVCTKLAGDSNTWFDPAVVFRRGTNNMALQLTIASGFTLSQFHIQANCRLTVAQNPGTNGYNASELTRQTTM